MDAAELITPSPLFLGKAEVSSLMTEEPAGGGKVQCVNPARMPGWDTLLAKHPHASFFHSAAWAAVLESTYDYTPRYFIVREPGALRSLLPMMEVDSWLTGCRGIALPFTDDCEPISDDQDSFRHLIQSATTLGRARGWKYVEFRGGRKHFGEAPASLSFFGHELDLTGTEEQLFGRVDGSVRRAIRKAEKEGVTVEVSRTLGAMRIFYTLLCQTRKKHGMPPQPFALFRHIHRHILSREMGVVILASYQGRPIAGGVYFMLGGRAIYKYGASDEALQHLRGNNLVMWEAIKWHAQRGCTSLNLGRTSLANEGLRRFKLDWGAVERPVDYVKYDLRRNRFVIEADGSSGWHNKVFQRLPIGLSKMIGASLYQHWA